MSGQNIVLELASWADTSLCPISPRGPIAAGPGVDSVHFSRHYLSCISLVTDFTPLTLLATLTAPAISAREFTKPLN